MKTNRATDELKLKMLKKNGFINSLSNAEELFQAALEADDILNKMTFLDPAYEHFIKQRNDALEAAALLERLI